MSVPEIEQFEELLEKWSQMLTAAQPSTAPLVLAALVGVLIFIVLVIWNFKALLNFLSVSDQGKRVSALAIAAWVLSVLSPWTGPLTLLGTPLSLFMGVFAWFRLPGRETVSPPQPSSSSDDQRPSPISYQRSVIPARMAVINSLGITIQMGALLAALYISFGSVLRDILWELWEHRELFQDYIVT